jgi:hypothetical protein
MVNPKEISKPVNWLNPDIYGKNSGNWEKKSDELWINKNNKSELIIDKLDDRWDLLLFRYEDPDAEQLFSSPNKKEVIWFAKRYIGRN